MARPIPVLVGLPDDGRARIESAADGSGRFVIPGTSVFVSQLPAASRPGFPVAYFHAGMPVRLTTSDAVVNLSADADLVRGGLARLSQWLDTSGAACFNHPAAVLASSREEVARRLRGIAGLAVPRTLRLRPTEPDELREAIAREGLAWPLIVRVAGTHTGKATVRIDDPRDIPASLATIPWGGRDLYVTEYVDYRDPDGLYRKWRIAITGGRAFLRHEITGRSWQLHAHDHDPAFDRQERALLDHRFPSEIAPRLKARLDAVTAAMDLDHFGLDCSLRPGGELLVFECNASMNILFNSRTGARQCDRVIARIRARLVPLLSNPSRWRHPGRNIAS